MKIKNALQAVATVVKQNSVLPILQNIVIGEGKIEATDLETSISCDVNVDFKKVCVDFRRLKDTIDLIGDDFTISVDDTIMMLRTPTGEFILPITPSNDYPVVPVTDRLITFNVDQRFPNYLKKAISFTERDGFRYAMSAISLIHNERLEICSTDAYKLYIGKLDVVAPQFACIVPTSFAKSIPETIGVVRIDDKYISFEQNGITVVSKLIDAKFPNYSAIFPTTPEVAVKLNRKEFVSFIKQAMVYSNKSSGLIQIHSAGDRVIFVTAKDLDFNVSCNIDTKIKADEFIFGVNGRMIIDCLSAIDVEEVMLYFFGSDKMIIFDADNELVCVMPMLINA